MKLRNIAVGVVVGGITIAGGVLAVAWQKGWSIRETVELGAGVIESKADGRTNLGGDIMIHGKAVTIGCVPVGDDAIEDIFYLGGLQGQTRLPQVRQAKLGRTNSGRSYIVKKSTYD